LILEGSLTPGFSPACEVRSKEHLPGVDLSQVEINVPSQAAATGEEQVSKVDIPVD
jgi:hypothetical protein